MTTMVETKSETVVDVVEGELRRLTDLRENPPPRANVLERLPRMNGDQDTW